MKTEELVGRNLEEIGRAADVLWMAIGKPVLITTRHGEKEVSEFAIHVQCPWRFIQNGSILLASYDIYRPMNKEYEYSEDWNWDLFNRPESEQSIFESTSNLINKTLLPLCVRNVVTTNRGDLKIQFDHETEFELFINSAKIREFWRLIDFRKDSYSHTVFFQE